MTHHFAAEIKKTADLFNTVTKDEAKWSPYRQMVSNVFNAYPIRAFTLEQINGIARAAEGLPADASLQDALSFYVRHKVLRRRDRKFYEVNF